MNSNNKEVTCTVIDLNSVEWRKRLNDDNGVNYVLTQHDSSNNLRTVILDAGCGDLYMRLIDMDFSIDIEDIEMFNNIGVNEYISDIVAICVCNELFTKSNYYKDEDCINGSDTFKNIARSVIPKMISASNNISISECSSNTEYHERIDEIDKQISCILTSMLMVSRNV